MRLCVVHINAERGSEPYTKLVDGVLDRVRRDEVEVTHRYASLRRASDTVFAYPYLLNTISVVEELARASDEGFDGAMVACSGDPGLQAARSVSSIPIVGPFEATAHLAASYGSRFGIITVADHAWADACESLVTDNGLASRFVGVARIHTPSKDAFTTGFTEPASLLDDMRQRALELVDRGAQSILIGSAGLSTIAAVAGFTSVRDGGVPVFDVLTVGLKALELRVDLSQRAGLPVVSRLGRAELFEPADRTRVRDQVATESH